MSVRKYLMATLAALVCSSVASATVDTLTLSTHSSDETDPSLLLATFDFSVVGTTLTITVTNDTSGANAYVITEMYFNFAPPVTSATEDGGTGWTQVNNAQIDGFGVFNVCMTDATPSNTLAIAAGASETFTFTIGGTGPFTTKDFTTIFSGGNPGQADTYFAAAKFVQGPGGDSAFGAVGIPLPAPVYLGALGLGGVVFLRRRKL